MALSVKSELARELVGYATYALTALSRYFEHPLPIQKLDFVLLPQLVVQVCVKFRQLF